MFAWGAARFLGEAGAYAKELAAGWSALNAGDAARFFAAVKPVAVDVAVLERTTRLAVVAGTFPWDDIGSWDALLRVRKRHVTLDLTHEPAQPLFYLAYQGLNDRDLQRAVTRLYVAPPDSAVQRAMVDRRGARRLQVGFVSRHLRNHTIGELFCGTLAQLNREALAVTVTGCA